MIPVLNLLAMGGGVKRIAINRNTIFARRLNQTFFVVRGVQKQMTVYVDTSGKERVPIDYTEWLPDGVSIASSTWSVENSNTKVTLADVATTATATEVYVSATTRHTEIWIKNVMVTDATVPETVSQSILVKTVRVVG